MLFGEMLFGGKCPCGQKGSYWSHKDLRQTTTKHEDGYSLGSTLGRLYCHRKQPVIATDSRKKKRTNTWIHFTSIAASLRRLRLLGPCWNQKREDSERETASHTWQRGGGGALRQTAELLQGQGLIPVLLQHQIWAHRPPEMEPDGTRDDFSSANEVCKMFLSSPCWPCCFLQENIVHSFFLPPSLQVNLIGSG